MTIKKFEEQRPSINLNGPEGNVFVLLGYVKTFGKQIGLTPERIQEIRDEMMSNDYEYAVAVFDREFGEYVDLYR